MSTVKIALVGDIMCGDEFWNTGFGVRSQIDRYGYDYLDPEIVRLLQSHDAVIGNVETVLSSKGEKTGSMRSMYMRGRPSSAELLRKWGLTAANVATNHILEHGIEAARDTAANLKKAGIAVSGSGHDDSFISGIEPVITKAGTLEIALIGACLRKEKYAFNGGGTVEELLSKVREAAAPGRIVVVSLHWGNEYIDRPALWQKKLSSRIIEAGAHIIAGHHPHVVQGVHYDGKALTAYSLGNFIFGGTFSDTSWSMVLSVEFSRDGISGYEIYPIINDAENRPASASGNERVRLHEEIKRRNRLTERPENEWETESSYSHSVELLDRESRKDLWRALLKNLLRINPLFWPQIFWRPFKRRLGRW